VGHYGFVITDVFRLSGATAVVGALPTAGEITTGDIVEIIRFGTLVAEISVAVPFHYGRNGLASLHLLDEDIDVEIGDLVQRQGPPSRTVP
jgi:hypothetical protein